MPKQSKLTKAIRMQMQARKLERVAILENGNTRVENLVKVGSKWEWSMVEVNPQGQIADCNDVFRKIIKVGSRKGQEESLKLRKHDKKTDNS